MTSNEELLTDEEIAAIERQLAEPNHLIRERTFGYSEGDMRRLLATLRAERNKLALMCELFTTYASHDLDCAFLPMRNECTCGLSGAILVVEQAQQQAPTGTIGEGGLGMYDMICLLCNKNSTYLAYSKFGEYPNSASLPEAQAFMGNLMTDSGAHARFMLDHAVEAHGQDRAILETSVATNQGEWSAGNDKPWLRTIGLNFG